MTSRRRPRATMVAVGRRPMNDQRPQRSPCSTDSRRKPGSSPTTRAKAATGVVRSASSSCQTGTTEYCSARARNSSRVGRITSRCRGGAGPEGPEEAGPGAGVAGPPALLLDDQEQGVAVAVVVRLADPLAVARGLALAPVLLAAAAPEPGPAGLQGPPQRLVVHPGQHEHGARSLLLHDGGDQPVGVEANLGQVSSATAMGVATVMIGMLRASPAAPRGTGRCRRRSAPRPRRGCPAPAGSGSRRP